MLFGGGSISYCGPDSQCHLAATGRFYFPNGITKGVDGLYYVAHSAKGKITVHSLQADHTLVKVDEIKLGIPVDNISVDAEGSIFAAAFPDPMKLILALDAPFATAVPSTVLRIRKVRNVNTQGVVGYEITKVLEDKHGKFLPSTTTAVHDAKTGRLFLGGVTSPFITICDRL
jgi:arylesterase / paraoxonase